MYSGISRQFTNHHSHNIHFAEKLLTSSPVSTEMGDHLRVCVTFASHWYLVNQPGQLSLAIPAWVGEVSTNNCHANAVK